MAAYQACVDYLLSAGGNLIAETKDLRLFYINQKDGEFILLYRDYSGTTLGPLQKVISGVKENTSAVYLCDNSSTPPLQLILCVSPSSTLRALEFDENEDEWTDSTHFKPSAVHPSGKLAVISDGNGENHVFFQDPAGKIVVTNGSSFQRLPADAIPSTPLSATFVNGNASIFYIAQDNFVHYQTFQSGKWVDAVLAQETFEHIPKRFVVQFTANGDDIDVFTISDNQALVSISSKGNKTVIGKVDSNGIFSPEITEECGYKFDWHSYDRGLGGHRYYYNLILY